MTYAGDRVAFPVTHGLARLHFRGASLNAHPFGDAS